MSDLTFVVGDDGPSVVGTLTNAASVAIDLTNCTVRFQMRLLTDNRLTVDATATITSTTGGLVRYDWATHDLDVAGEYESRWRIYNTTGGRVEHTDPANTITVAAV